jgi:hypothetical protein
MKILTALILFLFSMSAHAGLSQEEQEESLLKTCIFYDDEVFQLNYKISVKDDLIIRALRDQKVVEIEILKSTDGSEPGRLEYWEAKKIVVRDDIVKLMNERIELVKNAIHWKFQLASKACSNKVFPRDTVAQVCRTSDMRTKRWCQSKFF